MPHSVHVGGHAMAARDFPGYYGKIPPSRSAIDGEGKLRLALAHRDPGVYHWIDTQGFTKANLYRLMRPT